MGAILRPQQLRLVEEIDRNIAEGCRRIMVQAPTAYGKTIVAGEIARRAGEEGKRVIFTVPALSLIDQTVEKFYRQGIWDVGVIQANYCLPITGGQSRSPASTRCGAAISHLPIW